MRLNIEILDLRGPGYVQAPPDPGAMDIIKIDFSKREIEFRRIPDPNDPEDGGEFFVLPFSMRLGIDNEVILVVYYNYQFSHDEWEDLKGRD